MAAGKRVVHIATHGFFLDPQCPGSAVARENPLLRSGLALAGANQKLQALLPITQVLGRHTQVGGQFRYA